MDCERLKELRQDTGLTQKEFAEKLGINYSTYKSYEQGISEPSHANLILIAKELNISLDYLIGAIDYELKLNRSNTLIIKELEESMIPDLLNYAEYLFWRLKQKEHS